jgi:hypothetical protein
MTKNEALQMLNQANLTEFSKDEKVLLTHIVERYANRKLEDIHSLYYAINAMTPDFYGYSSTRQVAMARFIDLVLTKKGFYRVAQFLPMQKFAHEMKLTINFPNKIHRYQF